MVGPIVNVRIQSTVIVFDVRFLSSNFSALFSYRNDISTNLANITLCMVCDAGSSMIDFKVIFHAYIEFFFT